MQLKIKIQVNLLKFFLYNQEIKILKIKINTTKLLQ